MSVFLRQFVYYLVTLLFVVVLVFGRFFVLFWWFWCLVCVLCCFGFLCLVCVLCCFGGVGVWFLMFAGWSVFCVVLVVLVRRINVFWWQDGN